MFSGSPLYDVTDDAQELSSLFSPLGADPGFFTFCSSMLSADAIDSQSGTSGPNLRTVSLRLVGCIEAEGGDTRASGSTDFDMSTLEPSIQSGAISNWR
jgi:hypothetical protein